MGDFIRYEKARCTFYPTIYSGSLASFKKEIVKKSTGFRNHFFRDRFWRNPARTLSRVKEKSNLEPLTRRVFKKKSGVIGRLGVEVYMARPTNSSLHLALEKTQR